jgi:hypothetical protein
MADDNAPDQAPAKDAAPRRKSDDAAPRRKRVYPTGDNFIQGVPAQPMLLPAEQADWLVGHTPPAFTFVKPPEPEPAETPPEGEALSADEAAARVGAEMVITPLSETEG